MGATPGGPSAHLHSLALRSLAPHLRAACTVPHTVPVSYREAHVCKCGGRAHRPDPAPTCTAPAVRCRCRCAVWALSARARRAGVSFGSASASVRLGAGERMGLAVLRWSLSALMVLRLRPGRA